MSGSHAELTGAQGELHDARSYAAVPPSRGKDADQGEPEGDETRGKPKKGLLQRPLLLGVLALAAIAAAAAAAWLAIESGKYEGTDDAFVDTTIVHVAPRASGQVLQVFANDNQRVTAGQLLVQLDPSLAQTQIAQAEASKAQARSQIAQAQAQVDVSRANVEQAVADVRGPAAQAANAARDYRRYLAVQRDTPAAVAQQQVDSAQTTAANDAAQRDSALKKVKASRAQESSSRTQIGAGEAQLQTAEAQEAQAKLQVDYARVVAPVTGHVAHKTVAVGNYATQGQEVMSIVPDDLWVTANFKETQLQHLRLNQPVELHVDAYPKVKFQGHVDSIQRGAGQSFSVLPSQNASGNYVKVVQRVPVKIVFDRPDPHYPLGPGMSVKPRVRIEAR